MIRVRGPVGAFRALLEPGMSDLEALQAREDVRLMPLQRNARALLADLPSLGTADYITGNACATCTCREAADRILPAGEGTGIFGGPDALRWMEPTWRHSVAVLSRGTDFSEAPPCLLFFGETGDLAHQIALPDPASWEAFIDLVQRHHGCWNCLRHRPEAAPAGAVPGCPAWLLREAWCESTSERDLEARLEGLGARRILAVRALEGLYAAPIQADDLAAFLQDLASARLPLHAQVGNRHCTQVLEAPVEDLRLDGGTWEIRLARATLGIDLARLDSLWFTTRPCSGREVNRIEGYDAGGEPVLVLSGPRDAAPAVQEGWQRLIGRFEGRGLG